jgi:2-oxoglutarate ferredoxin oxidoreductase subunit beta
VYHLEAEYNPEDRVSAFKKALEWGDRIPIGIIYRNNRPTFEQRVPVIKDQVLIRQPVTLGEIRPKLLETIKEFF